MRQIVLLALLLSAACCKGMGLELSKSDSLSNRKKFVWASNLGLPIGTYTGLYFAWYKDADFVPFHWKNDNNNWLQMDKAGHLFSGHFLAVNSAASFRCAGYSRKKSAVLGTLFSLGFQTTLEYFDGRSNTWGASYGDLIANTAGASFGGLQAYLWGKVRVPVRVTFRTTALASIRPEMLGSNLPERLLKDYNGQTYWVDINPNRMQLGWNKWPKWLGVSFGYSAEGMLGGTDNIWTAANGTIQDWSNIPQYRQFLISPSIAFGHLKPKNKILRALCLLTNYWRIPMPTFEYNTLNRTRFHLIYW
jgi:uncharacterized protein YfiM (DUF2279 family)